MAGQFVSLLVHARTLSASLYGISINVSMFFPGLGKMWKIWKEGVRRTRLGVSPAQLQSGALKPKIFTCKVRVITVSISSDCQGDHAGKCLALCLERIKHILSDVYHEISAWWKQVLCTVN